MKITISKKYTLREKIAEYKKTASLSAAGAFSYKAYVLPNKKKEYDKKDKSYKSGY